MTERKEKVECSPLRVYYRLVSKDGNIFNLGYNEKNDEFLIYIDGFVNMQVNLKFLQLSRLLYQFGVEFINEDGSTEHCFLNRQEVMSELKENNCSCEVADIKNGNVLIYRRANDMDDFPADGVFFVSPFIPDYLLNDDAPEPENLLRQEKRAALKATIADELCTKMGSDVTRLPLSGRLKSKDGTIYHMETKGVLTALYLNEFENQAFLLDSQDLYRFIWQHELSYLTPGGCIKKLFQDATTAETYLKLNGTHCVWSPQTGFWNRINSDLLNNGNIANKTDSLPTGTYMAVESDFNISILLRLIQHRYKLTKWKLAHRLSCDVATIIFFENGKRRPSKRFLDKLSDAFPEYAQSISTLRKKDYKVLSVEDMTENLIDGVLIVRPFGSKLSATFKNEGILLETEGIEFLYPYREDEMLRLELGKFPNEGFKVIGVLNKVMIEGNGDLKELMKSAGKLSNKLGIGGIVFSSCLIDGKQEVLPDVNGLQELNYALYDLDDYLDSIKSKQTSGTLVEAMLGVSGAVPDNNNLQN